MTADKPFQDNKRKIPWLQLIPIAVGILTFLFGSGYFYNNIINRPILSYSVLPDYDLGDQYFSGVVVENEGNAHHTAISITISNLESEISALYFPGIHEPIDIIRGGVSSKMVLLTMDRLSASKSLSIYILSPKAIKLDENKLLISSKETAGQPRTQKAPLWNFVSIATGVLSSISAIFVIWTAATFYATTKKRKETEFEVMKELVILFPKLNELDKSILDLEARLSTTRKQKEEVEVQLENSRRESEDIHICLRDARKEVEELEEIIREGKRKSTEVIQSHNTR